MRQFYVNVQELFGSVTDQLPKMVGPPIFTVFEQIIIDVNENTDASQIHESPHADWKQCLIVVLGNRGQRKHPRRPLLSGQNHSLQKFKKAILFRINNRSLNISKRVCRKPFMRRRLFHARLFTPASAGPVCNGSRAGITLKRFSCFRLISMGETKHQNPPRYFTRSFSTNRETQRVCPQP